MLHTLLTFVVFCSLSTAHAWEWKDFKEELKSAHTDSKVPLYAGLGAAVTLSFMKNDVSRPFQTSTVSQEPLGKASYYGDILGQLAPNIVYAGGMAIAGYNNVPKGYDRAVGMFKATAYSAGVTTVLKYSVRERRPDGTERNSFPSGHTTTAFAFSGYVAAEHGWAWGVPATMMSSFVGYSRINDNRHWIQDVVAGAAIGWSFGWGMSKLEQRRKQASQNPQVTPPGNEQKPKDEEMLPQPPIIIPIADSQTFGLAFLKEF